jgi:hypothetical protein
MFVLGNEAEVIVAAFSDGQVENSIYVSIE